MGVEGHTNLVYSIHEVTRETCPQSLYQPSGFFLPRVLCGSGLSSQSGLTHIVRVEFKAALGAIHRLWGNSGNCLVPGRAYDTPSPRVAVGRGRRVIAHSVI